MNQNQIAPQPQSRTEPGQIPGHTSALFVRVMICLIAILTLGMVSLVFYRSQSIIEPTAAVLVIGDASLDGARVAVLSNHKELVAATLSDQNNYTTPILLQPGLYELEVNLRDQLLLTDRFNLQSMRYATFSLPTAIVVVGNASMAGDQVQISGDRVNPTSIELVAENGYTAMKYLPPGNYHVAVTRDGRIIKDQMLALRAHKPRRISLVSENDTTGFPQ